MPLEPLLENRIGIRGWLPIQSTNELSAPACGGLEVVVRFTKHDDYLKVIRNAEDIGWAKQVEMAPHYHRDDDPKQIESTNLVPVDKSVKQTVKCLIEIEKAVHLPTVYDERLSKECAPHSFVTFDANYLADAMQTSICDNQTAPKWNFQYQTNIDVEYFVNDKKCFMFKVWHSIKQQTHPLNNRKLLGQVSVDLTPLVYGLSHLSGWYNIQDSLGNCQGQLKLSILPQENMLLLKQQVLERKKSASSINLMPKFNSNKSLTNLSFKVDSCDADAKSGLAVKLDELDQLNKMFKDRLNKDASSELKHQFEQIKHLPTKSHFESETIEIKIVETVTEQHMEATVEINKAINMQEECVGVVDSFWSNSSQLEENKCIQYLEPIRSELSPGRVEHLPPIFPVI